MVAPVIGPVAGRAGAPVRAPLGRRRPDRVRDLLERGLRVVRSVRQDVQPRISGRASSASRYAKNEAAPWCRRGRGAVPRELSGRELGEVAEPVERREFPHALEPSRNVSPMILRPSPRRSGGRDQTSLAQRRPSDEEDHRSPDCSALATTATASSGTGVRSRRGVRRTGARPRARRRRRGAEGSRRGREDDAPRRPRRPVTATSSGSRDVRNQPDTLARQRVDVRVRRASYGGGRSRGPDDVTIGVRARARLWRLAMPLPRPGPR